MNVVANLEAVQRWLRDQQSTAWNRDTQDEVNNLVIACVYLLSQSIRSYKEWVSRHARAKKIKGRYTSPPNNKALRDLVDLVISDIDACSAFKTYQPPPPWLLKELGNVGNCEVCGVAFTSRRPAKCCSPRCRMKRSRCAKPERGIEGRASDLRATSA
jgi:hypothetical protein